MSGAAIAITREEDGSKGRYVANVEGQEEPGELTYSRASPTLVIVDRTGVEPGCSLRLSSTSGIGNLDERRIALPHRHAPENRAET